MSGNQSKKKLGILLVGVCLFLGIGLGVLHFYQNDNVKIITFDDSVKVYLEGNYKTGSDKLAAYNKYIRKPYLELLQNEVKEEYRENAKTGITPYSMQSIEATKWSYDLIREQSLIQTVKKTFEKCQKLYPLKSVRVVVFPCDKETLGITVSDNLIVLHVGNDNTPEAVKKELEWTCYHEYMHLISETLARTTVNKIFNSNNMLDDMIFEGKAVVFANLQMKGYESKAIKRIQPQNPWKTYQERFLEKGYRLTRTQDSAIGDFEFSRNDVYFYGKQYVQQILAKRTDWLSNWWTKPDKSFYLGQGEDFETQ